MIHPNSLEGHLIRLEILEPRHLYVMEAIASNPLIWQNLPIEGWRNDVFWRWAYDSLECQKKGQAFVFVVIDQHSGKIVGTTRYQDMDCQHNKTDIGWTWYDPSVWGKGYNFEAKKLMLTHAFEVWKVGRVGFKVDERNMRSQRALEKIGARCEGLIRKHMIRPDGSSRNSLLYGLTDEDWFMTVKHRAQANVIEAIVQQRDTLKYQETVCVY
ncbi:MAG: GNAT family N-acetyltransferase [Saprospiraceae bacterium]|nr:GNAT family N-acetyltransferase [Saprospiraceae bacterium]